MKNGFWHFVDFNLFDHISLLYVAFFRCCSVVVGFFSNTFFQKEISILLLIFFYSLHFAYVLFSLLFVSFQFVDFIWFFFLLCFAHRPNVHVRKCSRALTNFTAMNWIQMKSFSSGLHVSFASLHIFEN